MERYLKAINHKLFQVLFVTFSRRHLAHSVRSSLLRPPRPSAQQASAFDGNTNCQHSKTFWFFIYKKIQPISAESVHQWSPRITTSCSSSPSILLPEVWPYAALFIYHDYFFVTFIFLEITRSLLHRLSLIKKSRICFVRRKKCLLASHVFSQICFNFCIWPIFLYFRRPALRPIAYGLGNWYCHVLSLFISCFLPVKYFWDIFFYNRWPGNTPRYRGQSPWPYPILRSPRENTGWKLS